MCTSNPYQSEIHREVYEWSKKLSDDLLPRTRAYHEIWLDEEKVAGTPDADEVEPMYGPLYLPRKFKIGIAVPPSNDIDVFSQDLGFIAIVEDDKAHRLQRRDRRRHGHDPRGQSNVSAACQSYWLLQA